MEGGESKRSNVVSFFFFFEELHKLSGAPHFYGLWSVGSYITWPNQAECFHSWSRPDNLLVSDQHILNPTKDWPSKTHEAIFRNVLQNIYIRLINILVLTDIMGDGIDLTRAML